MKKRLLKHFDALSQDEKVVLYVLSATYIPIAQTRFQQLLSSNECMPKGLSKIIAKPLREKLVNLGLIEVTHLGWKCADSIAEPLIRDAAQQPEFFECLSRLVQNDNPAMPQGFHFEFSTRLLRIHLYQKNEKAFHKEFEKILQTHSEYLIEIYHRFFFQDFDPNWFGLLPLSIQITILLDYQLMQQISLTNLTQQYQLLKSCFSKVASIPKQTLYQYIELRIIRGDVQELEEMLNGDDSVTAHLLMGAIRFLQHRNEEALDYYHIAIKQARKESRKRNIYIAGQIGYFYCLALFQSQTEENLSILRKQLQFIKKNDDIYDGFHFSECRLLIGLDVSQARTQARAQGNYLFFKYHDDAPYDLLCYVLLLYWLGEIDLQIKDDPLIMERLNEFCQLADEYHYYWYAAVSSSLLERLSATNKVTKDVALKYRESSFNFIINLLPHVEVWERALDALTKLGHQESSTAGQPFKQVTSRMAWVLTMNDWDIGLAPREQKLGKNGRWSNGRPVAVKRLHKSLEKFDYLTEQDRQICSRIEIGYEDDYYSYYRKEVYQLNERALVEAIGHPHIYWEGAMNLECPVSISTAELQLLVSENKDQLLVKLAPYPERKQDYIFERTAADDVLVYKIEPQHHEVAAILGLEGLLVPKKAKQQVIDSISSIASMLTVQSDIGGQSSHAETVEADHRLHIHLQPMRDGIQIDLFVQPFADGGPVYKPGVGGTTVLAEIDGKQLQTTRDLAQEEKFLNQMLDDCPGLYHTTNAKWIMDDMEMALEALLQLQALGDYAVLEWPKGKAIKVSRETGFSQAQFSVRKEKNWFSVSGEIQVDDNRVMEMQNLMGLLATTPGRFLKLEDGQIIALTQELRQRLDDLNGLGVMQGKDLNFHPLAAQALNDITEGMAVKSGKHWKQQLKKLTELDDLDPQLPSTLQGELRDYQLQGYQWMVRLAHLGAGACLADDMGLGKTIQALALILSRALNGPTLILAPTSVCNNWLEEVQRFAPTLNVSYFGVGDRQQQLDNAGPFDLVVCSYGLLQSEADKLKQKQWHTIVADEAQAIKNPMTQRSKAAMALQGDFKIITTGTPIENHLGELWNLFNFINPGLLGSLKDFNERYAQDIENKRDHATQQRLKKLLQPFILRRLKNDVLTELPARTEVTLHVELSEEERTFYEALRRNAMQTIAEVQEQNTPPGQQHLKVLAEITKLRRACCNPRLVLAESEISSAKLEVFEALVEELIANHHKALVFSQFVSHLALIRELLDKKGINYQYLDGSTSMPKRKAAVNAFQSGQGDLFLISLKAGGSGLNLTAADYVVHMDPWWNPAVEDQASDRVHRMGQKRPVTIYRLVTKDTIEDKIVDLHQHKRDLANSLLKDGDVSGKMSVKEMLELLGDVV